MRSCALKALKIMVYKFHQTEFDLLLELLEEGLEFTDYRVRDSTLILIGDLLNGLAGGEGSVSYDTNATSETERKILEFLGQERRNEVFSVLYMARSDCEQPVRSRANITWKGLVYNSSRMLKSILDTLMHLLITALSSHNRDRQETGSKSLGDLVRNAAQFVLPKIVPVLRKGLQSESEDDSYKEGIALGLSEVLQNAHPRLIEEYETDLIESISLGIRDKLLRVRNASGKAFNVAVKVFGRRCINQIVPALVASRHIEGLKQLLQSPPKTCETLILPYLIKELLEKNEELQAISLLARDLQEHCSSYLNRYISDIFKSVCHIVAKHMFHGDGDDDGDGPGAGGSEDGEGEEMLKYGNKIIVDGTPEECTHLLLTTAIEFVTAGSYEVPDESKIVGLSLLSGFVRHSKNDFKENLPQLMKGVLELFEHKDDRVRFQAWNTLKDIFSVIPDEEIASHIDWFRSCIRSITNNGKKKTIAGFCIKNGLKPVMTMFDYGLRNGSFEEREAAAKMMAELISLSNLDAVKPFLNKIAGALIRICADRFPSNVKCAILQTLTLLISKYGALMKGFYTPLQTTFVKVIHDPSRDVRSDASDAILELMAFSTKFDNLLRDLNNYMKRLDDSGDGGDKGITISILTVMSSVLYKIGTRVKPQILADVQNTFSLSDSFRSERDDSLRAAASKCVAATVHCMAEPAGKEQMIVSLLDIDEEDDWRSIEYDLNSLAFIIADDTVYTESVHESYSEDIATMFEAFLENPQVLVRIAALRTGYYFVGRVAGFEAGESAKLQAMTDLLDKHLLPLLSSAVNNDNEDIVISSIEFLLESMLRGSRGDDDGDNEDEEKGDGGSEMNEIWKHPDIHQMIIPYVVENHGNGVQPALMRKCITTVLGIEVGNGAGLNMTHFNRFVANCNQKSVVKELTAIVDALT